ncbi:MAG TPA: hypothetical protein PK413_19135 [Thermoanaerobaculia bacterium]|nr:hypothetical protein [Thermoanaerobaculia bacterium]
MAEQSTPPGSLPIAWEPSIAAHDRRVLLLLLAMGLRIDQAKEIAQATWMRLFEQQQSGRLPRVELPGLLERHHAGLFTSVAEGWGLSLSEMLESGMPVWATRAGGVPDLEAYFPGALLPFPPPLALQAGELPRVEPAPGYFERFSWGAIAARYELEVLLALASRSRR